MNNDDILLFDNLGEFEENNASRGIRFNAGTTTIPKYGDRQLVAATPAGQVTRNHGDPGAPNTDFRTKPGHQEETLS